MTYEKLVAKAAKQALDTNDMNGALRAHEGDKAVEDVEQFHTDVQLHACPEPEPVDVTDADSGNADEKGA